MATVTQVRTAEVCPNYVNGQWVPSRSEGKLPRLNPADHDDIVGIAPLSTREEMREAIAAAKTAFPAWRDTPPPLRGRFVMQAARLMAEEKDQLARLMSREEGKTVSEAAGENVNDRARSEGRELRRVPDDSVSTNKGGGNLPHRDGDGEVPGGDEADDAERLADGVDDVLGQLGGQRLAGEAAGIAGGVF